MPEPKADMVLCDIAGCGRVAAHRTDGTEKDTHGEKRPAIPRLNVCNHHLNWPHSDDAATFALTPAYRSRK
jgi:hypothetical protein